MVIPRSVKVSLVLMGTGALGKTILGILHRPSLIKVNHHRFDEIGNLVHVLGLKWALTILRLMSLEVLFVFGVFILKVAILFDIVVVDENIFSFDQQVLAVLSSLGLVWSLETNEGVGTLAVLSFENSAGLDFSERLENISKISLIFLT